MFTVNCVVYDGLESLPPARLSSVQIIATSCLKGTLNEAEVLIEKCYPSSVC